MRFENSYAFFFFSQRYLGAKTDLYPILRQGKCNTDSPVFLYGSYFSFVIYSLLNTGGRGAGITDLSVPAILLIGCILFIGGVASGMIGLFKKNCILGFFLY